MKRLGMSNSDLARAAGVSRATISRFFSGASSASLATMAKLAHAVRCQAQVRLVPVADAANAPVAGAGPQRHRKRGA